jgi:hypothetical protein
MLKMPCPRSPGDARPRRGRPPTVRYAFRSRTGKFL